MPLTYQGYLQPGPIAPLAKIGEHILDKRVQNYVLYRVEFLEQVPLSDAMVVDFGAIAANGSSLSQSLQTPLEMDGFQMIQFRCKIIDDIVLAVYQPQNLPRFVTKTVRARFSKFGQYFDPYDHMTEMTSFQDEYPYVDVFNPTDYAVVTARAAFYGFRYQLSQQKVVNSIQEIGGAYSAVMGEGFAGVGFQRSGLPIPPR